MKTIRTERRSGRTVLCPKCSGSIPYTTLTNWDAPVPFFYADDSNDVLLRASDQRRSDEASATSPANINALELLWNDIVAHAPRAPSGGNFGLWTNVKCPRCRHEIPYNGGVRNIHVRIHEPKIVLVDGAIVLGDTEADTWRVCVEVAS